MASDIWFYIFTFITLKGICIQGQEATSIYFLHIKSDIKYRYASTLVTSKVVNPNEVSREVVFEVTLPDEAFITNFTLEISGTIHVGEVKEKEEARQQYEHAKSQGQSAGHISAKPRHANKFNMAVNVEAMGKVTFNLTYQERVMRKLGKYKHVIYINPGQPVNDFQIEVSLLESRDITSVNVLPIQNDILTNENIAIPESNDIAIVQRLTSRSAYILYNPSLENQTRTDPSGISGQFVVEYNVDRQTNAGDLLVVNGYFVHYFDFDDIEPLYKDVLFILDVSGSMQGRKLRQLKTAMLDILDNVHEYDRLNIMTFSSTVNYWKRSEHESHVFQATEENIDSAKRFIKGLSADGFTNIDKAMKDGIRLLSKETQNNRAPVLIFLTDGHATTGVTIPESILQNVKVSNEGSIPIFSLAFGKGADYNFVRRVAAQNNGFGRKIFEDADAALQIKGFYDEIATVLLKNVTFKYLSDTVDKQSLTQSNFNTFFAGSEIMVCGKLSEGNTDSVIVSVSSTSLNGLIQLNNVNNIIPSVADRNISTEIDIESLTEKLWAYLTIKQNLKLMEASTEPTETQRIKQKTLELSLKYNFVTPLTSMVVTLPNMTDTRPLQDAQENEDLESTGPGLPTLPAGMHPIGPNRQLPRGRNPLSSGPGVPTIRATMRPIGPNRKRPRSRNPLSSGPGLPTIAATMRPIGTNRHHFKRGNKHPKRKRKLRLNGNNPGTTPFRLPYGGTRPRDRQSRKKKTHGKHGKRQPQALTIPSFIIKIPGIMEPLCIDIGLSAGKTYKLLQHSQSGTLIYATTTSSRQVRSKKRRRRRKHHPVMVSRVTMATGGQSLTFLATKYSIDGTDALWDTDTFALNILNQNISFTVDVIPTNGSRIQGDEQLQIYSDISSNSGRLDGLLAVFVDVTGTVTHRKVSRGRRFAKLILRKGSKVYKLRRVLQHINPSNVIGSCWSVKKNVAKLLGVRPRNFENGSVL